MNAAQWLKLNRESWGIESGLHQRLDISYNDDDRWRVQCGIWIFGAFRRPANSLFMEWRGVQHCAGHRDHDRLSGITKTDERRSDCYPRKSLP